MPAGASRHRLPTIVWICLALVLGLAACGDSDTQPAQSVATIGVTESPPTPTRMPSPVNTASPTLSASTPTTDASPTFPSSTATMPPPILGGPGEPAITALDAATGMARWQLDTLAISDPLVGGDALYLIDDTPSLVAFDLSTGTERWRIPVPDGSALGVADETTAYLEFDGAVHAIDAMTGQERWVAAEFLALATGDGIVVGWTFPETGLRVLDAATGQERWSIAVGNTGLTGRLLIAGDTVFAGLPASERGISRRSWVTDGAMHLQALITLSPSVVHDERPDLLERDGV